MPVQKEKFWESSPATYCILIAGSIHESWEEWFGGMKILNQQTADNSPLTSLTGVIEDQAKLRGILTKLWDLNLVVISVKRVDWEGIC